MSAIAAPAPKTSKLLNILLWSSQVALAALFGMAGFSKATQPIAELAQRVPWAADLPEPLVRFIGSAEFAGALGLVLPALTRIRPRLTPLAAAGLVTIMALAALFHATRSEPGGIVVNVVLGSVAAFVAWGRYRKLPVAPRRASRVLAE